MADAPERVVSRVICDGQQRLFRSANLALPNQISRLKIHAIAVIDVEAEGVTSIASGRCIGSLHNLHVSVTAREVERAGRSYAVVMRAVDVLLQWSNAEFCSLLQYHRRISEATEKIVSQPFGPI